MPLPLDVPMSTLSAAEQHILESSIRTFTKPELALAAGRDAGGL
jgi:hypothetical protein